MLIQSSSCANSFPVDSCINLTSLTTTMNILIHLITVFFLADLALSMPNHDDVQLDTDSQEKCINSLPSLDDLLDFKCKDIIGVDYRLFLQNKSIPCCAIAKFRACASDAFEEACGPGGPSLMFEALGDLVLTCPRYDYPSVVCYVFYYEELFAWFLLVTCLVTASHCFYRTCCAAPKREVKPIVYDGRPRNGTTSTIVEYV